MAKKYSYDQMLRIMKIYIECVEGHLPMKIGEKRVLAVAPTFPIHNFNKELSKVKKYLSGRGAYGYSYPAGWSKAFIEVTNKNPNVIQALKEQQRLYKEKEGCIKKKMVNLIINSKKF